MYAFISSAGRRPIGPGLRVRRFKMTQCCQEPNGNSFSLSSSTEVMINLYLYINIMYIM